MYSIMSLVCFHSISLYVSLLCCCILNFIDSSFPAKTKHESERVRASESECMGTMGNGVVRNPFLYIPNMIGYARLVLVLVGVQLALPRETCIRDRDSLAQQEQSAAGSSGFFRGLSLRDGVYMSAYKLLRNAFVLFSKGASGEGMRAGAVSDASGGADRVMLGMMLYALGFVLDGVDGHAARYFNQESTMGKLLDMVTDRISTGALLFVLSLYLPCCTIIFVFVFWLDTASHWYHMYATMLAGGPEANHKHVTSTVGDGGDDSSSVDDSGNAAVRETERPSIMARILHLYYSNKLVFVTSCVSAELVWMLLVLRLGSTSLRHMSPLASAAFFASSSVSSMMPTLPTIPMIPMVPGIVHSMKGVLSGYISSVHNFADAVENYFYYRSWAFVIDCLLIVCFPFWLLKQASNVAQLVRAASICNEHDASSRSKLD